MVKSSIFFFDRQFLHSSPGDCFHFQIGFYWSSFLSVMKTVLITGASGGLGAALAIEYARKGWRLALTGRDAERLERIAGDCRSQGAEVHTLLCDVLARNVLHQWILSIDKRYEIDLVIANAGISGGTSGLSSVDILRQSRQIFDVNLTGVLNTVEPLIPRMTARREGQVALIASMASYVPMPGAPAYSASKAAIRFYGLALREKLKSVGVKINVISPGFVKTAMTDANNFPMPFMVSASKAAVFIAKNLDRNQGHIRFPFAISAFIALISVLPETILARLFGYVPEKTPLQKF